LRGLRRKDWIVGMEVQTLAFMPDPTTSGGPAGEFCETSINWEDDEAVLAFTLDRRLQSEHGVARLSRAQIDRIRQLRTCIGRLEYERKIEDGNPYHGNLLYRKGCTRPLEKMIASALALDAEFIPRAAP
jgi:hypothetical protein